MRIAELEGLIAGALPHFEELLAGRDFLFGHELSAADVVAFPFLKYALLWEEGDPDRFHEVLRDTQRARRPLPAARAVDPADRLASPGLRRTGQLRRCRSPASFVSTTSNR